jgi:hypothetical protein
MNVLAGNKNISEPSLSVVFRQHLMPDVFLNIYFSGPNYKYIHG